MKCSSISRTIRMPYQALTRCGVLWLQFEKARVLWQYVQLTPSALLMCIINAYVYSACLIDCPLPAGSAVGEFTRISLAFSRNGVNGLFGSELSPAAGAGTAMPAAVWV